MGREKGEKQQDGVMVGGEHGEAPSYCYDNLY